MTSPTPQSAMPDFMRQQQRFSAHLRDPERASAPADIEDRRMKIYRDLIFNNLSSLLAGNFPVIHRLLPREHWRELVRDFLRRHRAVSPLFPELPREFLDFLSHHRRDDPRDPPFLLELAHYEWVEMALQISDGAPNEPPADLMPDGDLLAGRPVLSPLAWNLSYRYPVHRIGPDYQPQQAPEQPTHLLVYLDRNEQVRFMELNAVTQRLLILLQQQPAPNGQDALAQIATELGHLQPQQVIAFGTNLLIDLRVRGVILGALRGV
ncbi:HvfC family RiPP maturation protein [Thiorhodovibrio frisius]|nr:putative DNA-binding domain-containing protein [Thiorhodovibrio frisius]